MYLNERLKELRSEKGITQEQLSNASGVGRITICRLETGELQNPKYDTIISLAKALDVPAAELFDR